MSRFVAQRSRGLAFCGLFLAVLANLGLTVHAGHHSLVVQHAPTSTRVIAEHSQPDPTLHLERVADVRTLTCPGCLLQQQISGSYLRAQWSPGSPSLVGVRVEAKVADPATRISTAQLTRGPPSC